MSKDYDPYPRSYGNSIFLICSALLFMGAIAIFIWLLIDASEQHFVKNILYAAAFLVITLGVLVYSLCAYQGTAYSIHGYVGDNGNRYRRLYCGAMP